MAMPGHQIAGGVKIRQQESRSVNADREKLLAFQKKPEADPQEIHHELH